MENKTFFSLQSSNIADDMLSMNRALNNLLNMQYEYDKLQTEYADMPWYQRLFNRNIQEKYLHDWFINEPYKDYKKYVYLNEMFREIWFADQAYDKLTVSYTDTLEPDVKIIVANAGEYMALSSYKGDALYERLNDLGLVDFIKQYEVNMHVADD